MRLAGQAQAEIVKALLLGAGLIVAVIVVKRSAAGAAESVSSVFSDAVNNVLEPVRSMAGAAVESVQEAGSVVASVPGAIWEADKAVVETIYAPVVKVLEWERQIAKETYDYWKNVFTGG